MLFEIIIKKILKEKFLSFLIILAMSSSIFFLLSFTLIYKNIENTYTQKTLWNLDSKSFYLQDKDKSSMNKVSNIFLKGENKLDKALKEIKTNPNIKSYYVIYNIPIESFAVFKLWSIKFNTDIIPYAISDSFFEEKWKKDWFAISDKIIDIYNSQFWSSGQFPKFSMNLLKILDIDLIFGKSSFSERNKIIKLENKINIIDSSLPLIWISIKESKAKEILKSYPNNKLVVNKIYAELKDEKYIEEIIKKYETDFNLGYSQKLLLKAKSDLEMIKYTFIALGIIIISILSLFIFYVTYNIYFKNKNMFFIFRSLWSSNFVILKYTILELSTYFIVSSLLWLWVFIYLQSLISSLNLSEIVYNFQIYTLWFYEISYIIIAMFIYIKLIWFLVYLWNKKDYIN